MTDRYDKVFLVGFMGSGKSTLGRRLASHLNWSFIDLDEKVEKRAGMKIAEIFEKNGEEWFRRAESEMLRDLVKESGAIISTGGGTPCFDNNMDLMLTEGLTIYLRMTPDQLKGRLVRSSQKRPLIRDISSGQLKGYIEKKLAEREVYYSRAEIVFDWFNGEQTDLYALVRKHITG